MWFGIDSEDMTLNGLALRQKTYHPQHKLTVQQLREKIINYGEHATGCLFSLHPT